MFFPYDFALTRGPTTDPEAMVRLGNTNDAQAVLATLRSEKPITAQALGELVGNEHCWILTQLLGSAGNYATLQKYMKLVGEAFKAEIERDELSAVESDEEGLFELFQEAVQGLGSQQMDRALAQIQCQQPGKWELNAWLNVLGDIYQSERSSEIGVTESIETLFRKQLLKELEVYRKDPSAHNGSEVAGTLQILGLHGTAQMIDAIWRNGQSAQTEPLMKLLAGATMPHLKDSFRKPFAYALTEMLLQTRPFKEAEPVALELLPERLNAEWFQMILGGNFKLLAAFALVQCDNQTFEEVWESLEPPTRTGCLHALSESPSTWLRRFSTAKQELCQDYDLPLYLEPEDEDDDAHLSTEHLSLRPEQFCRGLASPQKQERYQRFISTLPSCLFLWNKQLKECCAGQMAPVQRIELLVIGSAKPEEVNSVAPLLAQIKDPGSLLDSIAQRNHSLFKSVLAACTAKINIVTRQFVRALQGLESIVDEMEPAASEADKLALQEALEGAEGLRRDLKPWQEISSELMDYKAPVCRREIAALQVKIKEVRTLMQGVLDPQGPMLKARLLAGTEVIEDDIDWSHPKWIYREDDVMQVWHSFNSQPAEGEDRWSILERVGLMDREDFDAAPPQADYVAQPRLGLTWMQLHDLGIRHLRHVPEEYRLQLEEFVTHLRAAPGNEVDSGESLEELDSALESDTEDTGRVF